MTTLLAAAMLLWSEPTDAAHLDGLATYYADGLMEQVAQNRGLVVPDGMVPVALNAAGDLFREVWLLWPDGTVTAGYSVDCAQRVHYETRIEQGRVVEVPYQLAVERGFAGVGPVPVGVWLEEPPGGWR